MTTNKRSLNAKQVAKDVQKAILKGEQIIYKDIMEKRGYAKATIKNPKNVTESKTYKEEMFDFVQWIDKTLVRFAKALDGKDLTQEEVRTITDSMDKLNKNKLLATGGNTENIGLSLEISEHIAAKNGLSTQTPHN